MPTLAERISAPHRRLGIRRTGQLVLRDEYLDGMTFGRWTPPMFTEIFGPLAGLKEEWTAQGATPDEVEMAAFPYRHPARTTVAVAAGFLGGAEPVLLEDNAEHLLWRDGLGRTMKMAKSAATLALPMDYPVATMDDWRRLKPHYAYAPQRFAEGWLARARQARDAGHALIVHLPGGFDEPRQLMGEEALCIACYEQPELVHDILETITRTACRILDEVTRQVPIDQLDIHEDMAGRAGPLWGPVQVRAFMAPYYRAVWERAAAGGARLFSQDSDGDLTPILAELVDAGLNLTYPCEPTGQMDVLAIRKRFGPRLALMGGLDKHVLLKDRAAIDAELERKLPPLIATGGVIFGLDHRIPNGIHIETYRYYHAKVWEIIRRECAGRGVTV